MRKIGLVLVALFSLVLAGCSGTTNNTESKKTVKVGVIAPLSGPAATYGEDAINAIQDAVTAYMASNPDIEIELVVEDGKCSGKDATAAAQKLVNIDKIDVLVGGQCSSETLGAGVITSNNKVVTLSPVSSSPDISDMGPYVFRYRNDTFSSIVIGQYVSKNMKSIAVITENTDYAVALSKAFRKNYNGEILLEETFNSDEKDFSIIAKKINQNEDVDGVILITQSEATTVGVMKAFDGEKLLEKFYGKIVGAFFFSSAQFEEQAGELRDGLIEGQLAGVESAGEKGASFIEEFKKKHEVNTTEVFILLDQEAISLVIDAVKEGNTDSESIKSYFETIDEQNPRSGYFGDYYFDENGDAVGLTFVVQQYQDGEWKNLD